MAVVRQEEVRTVRETDPDTVVERTDPGVSVAARVIYLLGGVITALLALRFVLSLLGANRDNTFASLIYGLSQPFVAPFFGLFNYQTQYGVARFEFETLIAIAVWALVTWFLVRLLTLSRDRV